MLYDPKWKKPKKKVMRPAEVFEAAADVIQERGHSIGKLLDDEGRMCVWGAISFVMHGNPCRSSNISMRMLGRLRPFTGGGNAVLWNNQAGRTKRQVVSMLRKAAKAS